MAGCLDAQYVPGQFYGEPPNLRGICSGQGFCNASANHCVCETGWTGLSDFFGELNTDCHINVVGIQIEYGLLLLITLSSALASFKGLKRRWDTYSIAKAKAQKSGRSHGITKDKGLLSGLVWYAFGIPSLLCLCVLRIAAPEERIGVTVPITIFACLTRVAYNLSVVVYEPFLFAALVRADSLERMMNSNVSGFLQFIRVSSSLGAILGAASAFVPFASLGNTSSAPFVVTVYFGLSALALIYDGVIAYLAYQQAEKVFVDLHSSSVAPTPAVEKFRDKKLVQLKLYQYGLNITSTCTGLFFIMVCVWPFWWSLHDYFLPFTLLPIIKVGYDQGVGAREPRSRSK